MRHRNLLETFYAMYSPLLILLGNVICGLCYLYKIYSSVNYLSMLTGYSFVFIPQFIINYKRYKLCKFYKAATIFLFLSMIVSFLYQIGIISSCYYYIRMSIVVNIIGGIFYFFIRPFKKNVH